MAIACFLLFTFFFERPERSVPAFRSCSVFFTFLVEAAPYFFARGFFLAAMIVS